MSRLTIFLCVLVMTLSWSKGLSQTDKTKKTKWNLVKKDNNIKVYTRKQEHSKLKEIKMSIEYKMDINTFIEVLNDANRYTRWVYKCTESKILNQNNEDDFHYYVTSDLPFPASDRDLVVHCRQWKDDDGVYYSRSVAEPNLIPSKKGYVRIQKYESNWVITPKSDGTIHVDYHSISDPGGSIPAWIVNLAVTTGPLKTMKKLEKVVRKQMVKEPK